MLLGLDISPFLGPSQVTSSDARGMHEGRQEFDLIGLVRLSKACAIHGIRRSPSGVTPPQSLLCVAHPGNGQGLEENGPLCLPPDPKEGLGDAYVLKRA